MSVDAGSIVGIVGPSGCGKSTLLYVAAGLLSPGTGMVTRVGKTPAQPQRVSMVFQRDTLLPWLTVAENVAFYTRFRSQHVKRPLQIRRGRPTRSLPSDVRDRVDELLAMVKLLHRRDDYPYQLSGGMRRRAQFVAGVASNPDLLMLDEPFSSVDEPTRIGIHQDVFDTIHSTGMTAILVTHDLAEAVTLCDRVLVLSNSPSLVADEHIIQFGESRRMLDIRQSRDYQTVYSDLWGSLALQIEATATHVPERLS